MGKSFISGITYYNMCLGITGFIEYAKYILYTNPDMKFVPNFHSNTSTIESHFSLMCHYKVDTPANYQSTFNIVDNERAMYVFLGNKIY